MPGQLIQGHAKFEDDCEKCHQPFNKVSQTQLCRHCHEDIELDIVKEEGYHGAGALRERDCVECHTDHEGRQAQIVLFVEEIFDHEQTDFELKGKHKKLQCSSCHEQGKKFREAQHDCYECHKDDDPHDENLGKECSDCHTEKNWKETDFDHDKTDFKLRYKHRDVDCASCHPVEVSKKISKECVSCHRINDVHDDRYGKACNDCHTVKGWKKAKFDHDKETDYPLKGKHKQVACDACHNREQEDGKLKEACQFCHKNRDTHRGRYGTECEDCHTTAGWKKHQFDHDKDTEFPLKGEHKEVKCSGCHQGDLYEEELDKDCIGCHVGDDVHKEEQGKLCNDCHNETGWAKKIIFEHDMTAFPLLGLHAVAPCEECHLTQMFNDTEIACDVCHEDEDVHKQNLGSECQQCHNPNGWSIWQFDHNTETDYVLDGKHEGLGCLACHTEPTDDVQLSTACVDCHKQDDVHDGKLSYYCDRCHVTRSFKEIILVR